MSLTRSRCTPVMRGEVNEQHNQSGTTTTWMHSSRSPLFCQSGLPKWVKVTLVYQKVLFALRREEPHQTRSHKILNVLQHVTRARHVYSKNILTMDRRGGKQGTLYALVAIRSQAVDHNNVEALSVICTIIGAHPHELFRELFTVHGWELIADTGDLSQKRIVHRNLTYTTKDTQEVRAQRHRQMWRYVKRGGKIALRYET